MNRIQSCGEQAAVAGAQGQWHPTTTGGPALSKPYWAWLCLLAALSVATDAHAQADPLRALSDREAKARSVVVRFTEDNPSGSTFKSLTGTIADDGNGTLKESVTITSGNFKGQNAVKVRTPRFSYLIGQFAGQPKTVSFRLPVTDTIMFDQGADDGIGANPCLAEGLGLSHVGDHVIRSDAQGILVTGPFDRSLDFSALLDRSSTVPLTVSLSRKHQTGVYANWTYHWAQSADGRPRLLSSEFSAPAEKIQRRFSFSSIEQRQPTKTELQAEWFHPGYVIVDHRLGSPITWTYDALLKANGGNADLTPEKLKELSLARVPAGDGTREHHAGRHLDGADDPSKVRLTLWLTTFLPGLTVLGLLGIAIFRFRRRA